MIRCLKRALSRLWNDLAMENRKTTRALPASTVFWVLVTVVPPVTIISTHLWLRSAYTGDLFHLNGFLTQYENGIFRFRLLGREILLTLYRALESNFRDKP